MHFFYPFLSHAVFVLNFVTFFGVTFIFSNDATFHINKRGNSSKAFSGLNGLVILVNEGNVHSNPVITNDMGEAKNSL